MFEAVFRAQFKTGPGRQHINEGLFNLYYAHSPNTLLTKTDFNGLMPGKRVIMTMLFIGSGESQQCPRCHSKNPLQDKFNICICTTCSLRFDNRNTTSTHAESRINPIDFLLIPDVSPSQLGRAGTLQTIAVLLGLRRSTTRLITDWEKKAQPYDDLESFRNVRVQAVGTSPIQGSLPKTALDCIGRLDLRCSNRSEGLMWQYHLTEKVTWPSDRMMKILESIRIKDKI